MLSRLQEAQPSAPREHSYRAETLVEFRRFPRLFSRRQLYVDLAERSETSPDARGQIGARQLIPGRFQCPLENTAHLGFHGLTVLGGTDAQSLLYRRIKLANGDAAHRMPPT